MTEIKSVYEWKVALISLPTLDPHNTDLVVRIYAGEENTELACAKEMTRLITEKCKDANCVVVGANIEYIGDEL